MEETLHKQKTEYRKSKTSDPSHQAIEGAERPVQFVISSAVIAQSDDCPNDCGACVVDQHGDNREQFERTSGYSVFRSDKSIFAHGAIISLQTGRVKKNDRL